MTRAEIRLISRDLISQEDENNTDFDNNELNNYADEGIRFLATVVKYPRDEVSVQAELNVGAFTVPNDYISLISAAFGNFSVSGDTVPLRIMTKEQLSQERPNWRDETVTNASKPARIIQLDRDTLYIDPRPDAENSASGKNLLIEYVFTPPVLSGDSSVPIIPDTYHDLIPEYVQHKCYLGKLNKITEANAILKNIIEKSKMLEPVVVVDVDKKRMFWETKDSFESDNDGEILFR